MRLRKGATVLEVASPVEIATLEDTDFKRTPLTDAPVGVPIPAKETPETSGPLPTARVGNEAFAVADSAFHCDS